MQADGGGVFAGGRFGIEFIDDAVFSVGRGDDKLDRRRLEVLGFENCKRRLRFR